MGVALERIRVVVGAGQRICVHGDYDVDGICATVLAVLVLRELGADVEWHLPSRFDDGYGVSGGTLERLAEEGCGLVPTADCGITAAGRLGHPCAALELLLTTDREEARPLADRLEELNRDRQAVEEKIVRAAIDQVEEWPEAKRRRKAYVVWGEDWHEGVIGIVASRLVERYNRPVVLLAGGEGLGKGSGRAIPSCDPHAPLGGGAQLLESFGG